jgi:hypothetical protein
VGEICKGKFKTPLAMLSTFREVQPPKDSIKKQNPLRKRSSGGLYASDDASG